MKLSLPLSAHCQRAAVLTMALLVLAAAGVGAQELPRRSARDVHLKIETDQQAYTTGEPIALRLTLRNVSAAPVRFVSDPPVVQAHLRVYDAAGREVAPTSSHIAQDLPSRRPLILGPGDAVTLKWQGREWLNLRDWGYDLREPGRYTIVGIPAVVGPRLTPDYNTVRSNRATLTIEP